MKKILILVIFISLISCQTKTNRIDFENDFRNQTFNLIVQEDNDTITIHFKDSTFTVYEYNEQNLPWSISTFKDNDFIIFNKRVIALEKESENVIKGFSISKNNTELIFEKRKKLWNKEMLNGIWIEQNHLDTIKDSSYIPPPPPEVDSVINFQFQPYYQIEDDSIFCRFDYQLSTSKIEINNTIEFLQMDLESNYDQVDILWEIKELNDSTMLINRKIEKGESKFNFYTKTEENIKLIKKS